MFNFLRNYTRFNHSHILGKATSVLEIMSGVQIENINFKGICISEAALAVKYILTCTSYEHVIVLLCVVFEMR